MTESTLGNEPQKSPVISTQVAGLFIDLAGEVTAGGSESIPSAIYKFTNRSDVTLDPVIMDGVSRLAEAGRRRNSIDIGSAIVVARTHNKLSDKLDSIEKRLSFLAESNDVAKSAKNLAIELDDMKTELKVAATAHQEQSKGLFAAEGETYPQ